MVLRRLFHIYKNYPGACTGVVYSVLLYRMSVVHSHSA